MIYFLMALLLIPARCYAAYEADVTVSIVNWATWSEESGIEVSDASTSYEIVDGVVMF